MNQIDERLQEIAREVFGDDSLVLTDSTKPVEVPGWDSLGHVNFMLSVENEFGVEFSEDEFVRLCGHRRAEADARREAREPLSGERRQRRGSEDDCVVRSASLCDNLRTHGSDFVLRSGDPRATVPAALERPLPPADGCAGHHDDCLSGARKALPPAPPHDVPGAKEPA